MIVVEAEKDQRRAGLDRFAPRTGGLPAKARRPERPVAAYSGFEFAQWQQARCRIVEQRSDPACILSPFRGAIERVAPEAIDLFHRAGMLSGFSPPVHAPVGHLTAGAGILQAVPDPGAGGGAFKHSATTRSNSSISNGFGSMCIAPRLDATSR